MHVSVRQLYRQGCRLEKWEVLASRGSVGHLVLGWNELRHYREARLIGASGVELLPVLVYAKVEQIKGAKGMLVEGIQPRQRGSKHTWRDQQAWWCHAPPKPAPLRSLVELRGMVANEFSTLYDDL